MRASKTFWIVVSVLVFLLALRFGWHLVMDLTGG